MIIYNLKVFLTPLHIDIFLLFLSFTLSPTLLPSLRYLQTALHYLQTALRYLQTALRYFQTSLRYLQTALRYLQTSLRHLQTALRCLQTALCFLQLGCIGYRCATQQAMISGILPDTKNYSCN
jgi:hypothetical protein